MQLQYKGYYYIYFLNILLQTFSANTNNADVVTISLDKVVLARYLRVVIISYEWWPALRLEVLGFDCAGKLT